METLLIIDDDVGLLENLQMHFEEILQDGAPRYHVMTATSAGAGLKAAAESMPSVVILDMMLPDRSGLEIIEEMKALCGDARIILVTAHHDMETTIRAMKAGAFDYIHKPFSDPAALDLVVDRALEYRQLSRRAASVNVENTAARLGDIVGNSPLMQQLVKEIGKVTSSRATVLINGESGTGKELFARVIHNYSYDEQKPFIGINCSAIVDTLLESELFGHEKGSFTGAMNARKGAFEEADGGTLFLDEIGELPLDLQAKLLRALESGEIKRVGASRPIHVDVRVLAATNRDLLSFVRDGRFREDLYYRVCVVPIVLPPLRNRSGDLAGLADHFVRMYAPRGQTVKLTPAAVEKLQK
ncbi:MAG TPA: sigma-54 dependent transcriptional regulator, partial [Myxococcaceae bacterium]|nr:sigma-54 dependent transcriptional regulator [Myxococcaceae bacterium]